MLAYPPFVGIDKEAAGSLGRLHHAAVGARSSLQARWCIRLAARLPGERAQANGIIPEYQNLLLGWLRSSENDRAAVFDQMVMILMSTAGRLSREGLDGSKKWNLNSIQKTDCSISSRKCAAELRPEEMGAGLRRPIRKGLRLDFTFWRGDGQTQSAGGDIRDAPAGLSRERAQS